MGTRQESGTLAEMLSLLPVPKHNRPFATNDHMVQNPPCWRASSLLFPHWDIKTKRPQPVKRDWPLFQCPSAGIIMSLPSSMADFVPCDRLLQKAYFTSFNTVEERACKWLLNQYYFWRYAYLFYPSRAKIFRQCKWGFKVPNVLSSPGNHGTVPSAGKHVTCAKRGKTWNCYQARENMQPVPSAGKHATSAKRGKTCNCYQARENVLNKLSSFTPGMEGKVAKKLKFHLHFLLNRMKSTIILKQRK